MADIICYKSDGKTLDYYTQWDVGQQLMVKGVDLLSAPYFYFTNSTSDTAYVMPSEVSDGAVLVNIPDILLQDAVPLIVYISYSQDGYIGTTEHTVRIPVMPRTKPDGYIYNPESGGSGGGSGGSSGDGIGIANNLTTNNSMMALSAAQGVVLKAMIDTLDNEKVDTDSLSNEIKSALDQAIAGGEIVGGQGEPGKDGNPGKDGEDGRGIVDVLHTSGDGSPGSTDIYTIIYSDETTTTFSVYNGKDGVNGSDGENGSSANITIDDTLDPSSANPVQNKVIYSALNNAISTHSTDTVSHNDIRVLISDISERLNALANSTDEDLDQMAEIVEYIKSNKTLIDSVTTAKVNVSDIIDNLITNVEDKPLSAAQGVVIKSLIDTLQTSVNSKASGIDLIEHASDESLHVASSDREKWDSAKSLADSSLQTTGGYMSGSINMDGNRITGLPEPNNSSDPATRYYVDSGLSTKLSAYVQTEEPVDATDGDLWIDLDANGTDFAPVRGVDYWTEEDIAEIKSYVDKAILGGAW